MKMLQRVSGLALVTWMLTLTGCANNLFYYPTRQSYGTPAKHKLAYEAVTFTSRDGTRLTGWFVPAVGKPQGTVIHFHGNAQNMSSHFSFVHWLPREGFNVFIFDYRGYGASQGTPSRTGVYEDSQAALDYVTKRPDVDPDDLVVLAQSLGGANALAVLGAGQAQRVRAVAIDSSFYSYRLIVRDKIKEIPLLGLLRWPLSFLVVSNRRSGGPVIKNIAPTPLLILHGTADRVVPFRHGRKLLAAARDPKALVTIPNGRHTDAFTRRDPAFREKLVEFYREALDSR